MDYSSIKQYFKIKQDQGNTCKAVCPCHKDKEASLSISYKSEESKTLVFCHAGCETRDILDRVGLKISDLFDKAAITSNGSSSNIVAVYKYKDAEGNLVFEKVRFKPKKFSQRRYVGDDVVWGLDGGTFYETYSGSKNWSKKKKESAATKKFDKIEPVLYNLQGVLESIKNDEPVFIVEGEKDADNLIAVGLTATCNFDGASKSKQKPKWSESYNPIFKNAKVICIPDNDNPGRAHMHNIAKNISSYAKYTKIVELPGLSEKQDTSDWLEEGHSKNELLEVVNAAEAYDLEYDNDEKSVINFNFSDVGNAERLIYINGKNIRYSPIRCKFLIWSGKHWEIDSSGKIERLARAVIRKLQYEGESLDAEENEKLKKQISSFVLKSENDGRIKAMINQSKSQQSVILNKTDSNIYLINVKNGTLNLKTSKLKKHDRKDNITKIVNIEYKPGAKCPNWEAFLNKIFLDDQDLVEYMQKTTGYSLTGDITQQCFYMCYGDGANGKSTFLNTIEKILGDYADTLKGSSLMVKRNDDGARGDLAKLQGKRFVIASELNEGQTFDESLIKALTGGDTVPVRYLYGEDFPLRPEFKLWIGTNEKPKVKGTNKGIWRRLRIIPFMYTIPDKERSDSFYEDCIEPELSGILNWAIEGCMKWQKEGIAIPEKVLLQVEEYKTEMDVIQRFMDDCCIVGNKFKVKIADIYDTYCKWCSETKEYELSSMKFTKKLKQKGFEQIRTNSSRMWEGIGLIDIDHSVPGIVEIQDGYIPFDN